MYHALTREKRCDQITNLCDEFLHIDETPEANVIESCCYCKCCKRKSVTCVAVLSRDDKIIFDRVYKNRPVHGMNAIHAERLMINDSDLISNLDTDQTLTLYLTLQPCHYSGGHVKAKDISCTNALIAFHERWLKPLNVKVSIRFAYLYRAHWTIDCRKYEAMIINSNIGLKLLTKYFDVDVMKDFDVLYKYCSDEEKKRWDMGEYSEILIKRNRLQQFMIDFLNQTKSSNHT